MNPNPLYRIDNLGNLINQVTEQIDGYYDSIVGKCYLMDGTEIACPTLNPNTRQATALGSQTFYWAAAIAVGLWWLNRRSK